MTDCRGMSRLQIRGSESADVNLEHEVCSHLLPIRILLQQDGDTFDPNKLLTKDKDGLSTRFVSNPIDFSLIESSFVMPSFIVVDKKEKVIFCRRCWCEIRQAPSK